jgi:NAD(P)-dependent dehydrogenase (short-subunit alcohol dehydrogenase family)
VKKPFGLALALTSFVIARMMLPRDSFAGKVVVITGGSRGLGLALARRLAQENAKLAILARDQQELVRAKADLDEYAYTPGEEGLQDHRLMEAIYESAKTGKPVQLMAAAPSELDRFRRSPPQS